MRLAGIALERTGDAILWVTIASIAAHIAAVFTHRRWPVGEVAEDVALLVANIVYAIGALLRGQWEGVEISGAAVVIIAWHIWRRHRRERKQAAELIGAKSRAIRDGLVRRMREVAKPGPVLRPSPGGAR